MIIRHGWDGAARSPDADKWSCVVVRRAGRTTRLLRMGGYFKTYFNSTIDNRPYPYVTLLLFTELRTEEKKLDKSRYKAETETIRKLCSGFLEFRSLTSRLFCVKIK